MVFMYTMTTSGRAAVDSLDAALIELLAAEPRVGVLEASKRLRVARGTVQARLDRLQERGVITGYGPEVDPAALGYEVTAFITLEIRQAGGHDSVAERLAAIPEVLEVHTITGAGDMLCRVVARSNADLQRVIDAIVSAEGVVRSATLISLAAQVQYRVLPLVRSACRQLPASPSPYAREPKMQDQRTISLHLRSAHARSSRMPWPLASVITIYVRWWRYCNFRVLL
jgi:DNA-binding Lrp family transcriptional regulator